jgi:periplasmic protein TonB
MAEYAPDSGYFGRRAVVFVIIVAFHVFVFWGFASGFARRALDQLPTILDTKIIEEDKPKEAPPPPPPPDLNKPPPVQVVVPDINITVPADAPPPVITNITTTPVKAPPRAPAVVTPSQHVFPSTADYYPPASVRANESGRPIVHYCIDAGGRIGTVTLAKTSGFDRLDEAAVSLVKAATRVRAAQQEGRPIATCSDVAVKFDLKDVK